MFSEMPACSFNAERNLYYTLVIKSDDMRGVALGPGSGTKTASGNFTLTFTPSDSGGSLDIGYALYVRLNRIFLTFNKYNRASDLAGNKTYHEIEGAVFTLYDTTGKQKNDIKQWTTTYNAIKQVGYLLTPGHSYEIIETYTPEIYSSCVDVSFSVNDDGTINIDDDLMTDTYNAYMLLNEITGGYTTISIKKIVAGNLGDKSKEFHFIINATMNSKYLSEGLDPPYYEWNAQGGSMDLKTTSYGYSDSGEMITYYNYEASLMLSHDDTVELVFPPSVTYSISEIDDFAEDEDYETTITINNDGTNTIYDSSYNGNVSDGNKEIIFTNSREMAVPTGVFTDRDGFIAMFLVAALIMTTITFKRRIGISRGRTLIIS